VHTSTVTVAVIDPAQPVTHIRDQDLRIEWYSGTGAGGQYRNKHQNSCRITHIPTGITAKAECRSRANSLEQARSALAKTVDQKTQMQYNNTLSENRRQQVGSGQRGDKIRTYRFQDDSVQDHNTGCSARCSAVLKGNVDLLWR
jgi:peptide chain release factor 1